MQRSVEPSRVDGKGYSSGTALEVSLGRNGLACQRRGCCDARCEAVGPLSVGVDFSFHLSSDSTARQGERGQKKAQLRRASRAKISLVRPRFRANGSTRSRTRTVKFEPGRCWLCLGRRDAQGAVGSRRARWCSQRACRNAARKDTAGAKAGFWRRVARRLRDFSAGVRPGAAALAEAIDGEMVVLARRDSR
jgi:hypothetical protein